MSRLSVHVLCVDPQNDFMDSPDSALPVPGANADMDRGAAMIDRCADRIADVHVTMDSHYTLDYRHPGAWKNGDGEHPVPITQGGPLVTADDIENGIWTPLGVHSKPDVLNGKTVKEFMIECAEARSAETGGAVPGLEIWPEHCIIGTSGHNVQGNLMAALQRWERKRGGCVDWCVKGTNVYTEHYGGLQANVVLPTDSSTGLNTGFLEVLQTADIIAVMMEALSHCGMSTVNQIRANFGKDELKKIHLLTDATSPVPAVPGGPDFPAMGQAWLKEVEAEGMVLTTTTEFLA